MFKKLEVGQIVPELQGKDIIQFDLSDSGCSLRIIWPDMSDKEINAIRSGKLEIRTLGMGHVMFILLKKYRFGLDIDYHFVTERLIKKVHKCGLKINAWTVDDKLVAEQFAKWGIDQITSNGLE